MSRRPPAIQRPAEREDFVYLDMPKRALIAYTTPHRGWRKAWAIIVGDGFGDLMLFLGGSIALAIGFLLALPEIIYAAAAAMGLA